VLKVKVTPGTGAAPSATFTFKDVATTLGTANVSGDTEALPIPGLHAGSHSLRAFYNGSATALPSSSNTVVETISQSSSTTFLSSAANSTVFGKSLTFTATATSSHGGAVAGSIFFRDGGVVIGTAQRYDQKGHFHNLGSSRRQPSDYSCIWWKRRQSHEHIASRQLEGEQGIRDCGTYVIAESFQRGSCCYVHSHGNSPIRRTCQWRRGL
jgi:hypothetical protein